MKSCHNCRSKTVLKDSGMQPDPDLGAEGHSALVPLVDYQGCSCDSFTWTVRIFKNRIVYSRTENKYAHTFII